MSSLPWLSPLPCLLFSQLHDTSLCDSFFFGTVLNWWAFLYICINIWLYPFHPLYHSFFISGISVRIRLKQNDNGLSKTEIYFSLTHRTPVIRRPGLHSYQGPRFLLPFCSITLILSPHDSRWLLRFQPLRPSKQERRDGHGYPAFFKRLNGSCTQEFCL